MKALIIFIFILNLNLFAFNSKVERMFAIGIFDSAGNGENIQNVRKTKRDYNGTCYTKIYLMGKHFSAKPRVEIGDSIGHYETSKPIFNKSNIKVGEVIIFKHLNVTNGIIKVYLGSKLYDSRVYVR